MIIQIVQRAAEGAGGIKKLAAGMGISRQALHGWDKVPAERVLDMERASQGAVTRQEIRPDLFGGPANEPDRRSAA